MQSKSGIDRLLLLACLRIVLVFDGNHPQLIFFRQRLEESGVGIPERDTFGIPVALLHLTIYLTSLALIVLLNSASDTHRMLIARMLCRPR